MPFAMLLDEPQAAKDIVASMPDEELLERSFKNPHLFEKLLDRYE